MTQAANTAERKRSITRWNRRLGLALAVIFPLSYLVAWMHDQWPHGILGSWLAAFDIGIQASATVVLLMHGAFAFHIFGFPAPRFTLRSLNGYFGYLVLLLYLLAQTANGKPSYDYLHISALVLIALHVCIALRLASKRPKNTGPSLQSDFRRLVSPDAELLEKYAQSSPDPAATALAVRRLTAVRGQVDVLFGIDLAVESGQVVALLGNNGAGKTTTLRAIAGLESATTGKVEIAGRDVSPLTPAGRAALGLGLVVGGQAVFAPMTVTENLELFGHRLNAADRRERFNQLHQVFPWLVERGDQVAGTLSGGEQQMLALARAFIDPPKVLLVDEFSLGLAPRIVDEITALIRDIAARGTAVLLVEQSAHVALALASRVLVMGRGRITLDRPVEDVQADPALLEQAYLKSVDSESSEAMA